MSKAADVTLAVMGAGGVGKSALTLRFGTGNFSSDHDPTIEDVYRIHVDVDATPLALDILDTAGQDEFVSMQDQWARQSQGVLLVYAVDSRASFNNAKALHAKIQRVKPTPVVLVGNKNDLDDAARQVTLAEGEALAAELGVSAFMEASAKAQVNNETCFIQLVKAVRTQKPEKPKKKSKCTVL